MKTAVKGAALALGLALIQACGGTVAGSAWLLASVHGAVCLWLDRKSHRPVKPLLLLIARCVASGTPEPFAGRIRRRTDRWGERHSQPEVQRDVFASAHAGS